MKQQIWQGFEQLNNENTNKHQEFNEELPLLGDTTTETSRRDFLKVLGFSVSAAAIAASCEIPVRKAIPYVFKPEEIVPGIANYYASSFINGSDYCSVLVKTREGRPIKIEGNSASGITHGGTSARAQASIMSLYDMHRLRYPKKDGQKTTWKIIDGEIAGKLSGVSGSIALVTSSVISPSTRAAIAEFRNRYPNTRHVVYEPMSNAGMLYANEQQFGTKAIASYRFDKASVIASFGADFLGTWVSPIEFAAQYAKGRKVSRENPVMSKHWQFEGTMSLTGANADKRYTILPSQEGAAVVALYNALSGGGGGLSDANAQKGIEQLAMELKANAGKSLVVAGSNDSNVQMVVNAINGMLGNYGNTISIERTYNVGQGDDKAMTALVNDMNAGSIGAVIFYGVNPAYSYPEADKFVAGLKKVPVSISFNDREDETAANVKYLCPDNHYLESWNDAEPKSGYYSLAQPAIAPLFDTRQAQESLLTWAGNTTNFYNYIRSYWQANVFGRQNKFANFNAFWEAALHDGIFETDNPNKTKGTMLMAGESTPVTASSDTTRQQVAGAVVETVTEEAVTPKYVTVNAANAISAIGGATGKANGMELLIYENVMIGDGSYSANPFLQESPEPISKVCWDNVLLVSPKYGKEQGWKEKDIIEVKAGNYKVEVPVIFQPGQAYGSCALAIGYGRTKTGAKEFNVGKNVYPFVSTNADGTFNYVRSGVSLTKVGSNYALARTQTHGTIDDERFIVGLTSLDTYKKDKFAGNAYSKEWDEKREEGEYFTLYGSDIDYGPHGESYRRGHRWALSIDLNSCIGCGACVPACHIENNVPVVGQNEVVRVHEMHWMRIDRYYMGADTENPEVVFMPMMCQHCENAPCENVCPVAATNHSGEGLNQMTYNRCIGTRYCANNCPYKVRRFNWFDYHAADSFYKDTIFDNDEYVMFNDLTRMVLNPDVTVRSRGVIEKCSFCVQRIQDGKLAAKRDNRQLKDGEIKTACQTACPTEAIIFGDFNNPETKVAKLHANERNYYCLEELHIVPGVGYMTKIKNREERSGIDTPTPKEHTADAGHGTHQKPAEGHGTAADTTEHGGSH